MKFATFVALAATAASVLTGPTAPASAQTTHTQGTVVTPQQVQWRPGPPSLPPGAQVAVLYGDPSKEGPFAMRLRLPANSYIAPHTHSTHEIVTVISGTFLLGHGAEADRAKTQALPAGSLFAFPPGSQHYGFFDEESVAQITTTGPWTINYVNSADDPRKR